MKLSIVSVLSFASAMVSASAIPRGLDTSTANVTEKCIEPKLCCKKLTTPLDPLVDGLLGLLDINGKAVTGEVGLLCNPWSEKCESPPSCCTEANVLNGVLALGCSTIN